MKKIVSPFDKEIEEFSFLAADYIRLLENVTNFSKRDFLFALHKILPSIYLSIISIPLQENQSDDFSGKYVTEEAWDKIQQSIAAKIGQHNSYLDVFDPTIQDQEMPVAADISDHLSDIYQDLKDFYVLFNIGNEVSVISAFNECKQNFETYWGQKLVNVLRAIHCLCYGAEDLSDEAEEKDTPAQQTKTDTSSWFISQRKRDFFNDEISFS